MNYLGTKLGVASASSIVLTEALHLENLWNALLSLGISILSVLAVEGIALLKAYLQNKKRKLDEKSKEE